MKQAGFGVAGASGLVASVFLTLPLVRGMRQTLEVAGEKELSELGKYCTSCRSWCCWFSACSPGSASTHPVLRLRLPPCFFTCSATLIFARTAKESLGRLDVLGQLVVARRRQAALASWSQTARRRSAGLRGVVHVVGGPDVLHGRVLAALLRPEERFRQAVGCAACESHGQPCRCRCANSRRGSHRSSSSGLELFLPEHRLVMESAPL